MIESVWPTASVDVSANHDAAVKTTAPMSAPHQTRRSFLYFSSRFVR